MSSVRTRDPQEINVRKLAMKCLMAFIHGQPEWIRVRTVEAGIVPGLVTLLECFWRCMEGNIRERIERELSVRPIVPPVVKRRVTIGAHSPPGEFVGLQIRFPMGRHALSRLGFNPDVLEVPARRVASDLVAGESDGDRMDVYSTAADDDNTDGEALRSPPPEEDNLFPFIAGTHGQPLERSPIPPMDIDDVYTTSERPSPPSTFRGMAPNAPLPTFSVPGETSHRRIPSVPTSHISTLYATSHPDDRVPRKEDIQECLDLISTLSKHPQTREYFTNTRLIPTLLHSWQKPEDTRNPVNVFQIVERFTFADFHPPKICASASSIMRNYQRKDPDIPRPCGNLHCKTRESDRKFICCSQCRLVPTKPLF